MTADLLNIVETTRLDTKTISERTARIHADVLNNSNWLDAPNFTSIHPDDLAMLFHEYDRAFFDGNIRRSLGDTQLEFDLSKRMTSAGGSTTRRKHRCGRPWFEIKVSTPILFGSFRDDDHRPITTSGILCRDRLDAMQRVMEHEIVHLIEWWLWDESSCSKSRFHSITRRFFGHTENKHKLITPRERALAQYGIRAGMKVRFRFDGVEHLGIVNRVTKRATVLVEDQHGARYSDGKHYSKFYIPVQMLEAVE